MTDIATHHAQFGAPRRQHARHFFGTMGATMRQTSQWLETRRNMLADIEFRRGDRFVAERRNVGGEHCD